MKKKLSSILQTLLCLRKNRGLSGLIPATAAGRSFSRNFRLLQSPSSSCDKSVGRLREIFDAKKTGNGVLKWLHYFDIYERHFSRFVNTECTILEIGVYSGGSLEMWRNYFGPKCKIIGVDIEPACRQYENEYTQILIGDQADPGFWDRVCEKIRPVDMILDDGGHAPGQQRCTLENSLKLLKPGGVFACEDIQGLNNEFAAYCAGMTHELNRYDTQDGTSCRPSAFQSAVRSICFYPFIVIVERNDTTPEELRCVRKGTIWQPFLGD